MSETEPTVLDRSRVEQILRTALSQGASDVHFKAGEKILLRIRGELHTLDLPKLSPQQTQAVLEAVLPARLRSVELETLREIDFSFAVPGAARFRANAFRQRGSLAIVVRVIPIQIPDLRDLGLPEVVARLAEEERGIVLVTGATGSGKSTTLASMIKHINRTTAAHVVTIEDPIEFLFQNERSSIVQREIGTDTDGFAAALRAALRQDPDVIMIGEMRDAETMDIAIKAAETGHLVLSTAHTTDAARTIDRLLGAARPSEENLLRLRLSEALRAIVSMRLLPRADASGLVPAIEVMVNTRIVQDCIRNADRQAELQDIIAKGAHYGMRTFDQDLIRLVREGAITRDVALAAATTPGDVDLQLRIGGGETEEIELATEREYSDELAEIDPSLRITNLDLELLSEKPKPDPPETVA
ncbi:MAG: PilT/PilU family type 4a pilus ATPase [Deltaproteobacteria bacterium]|nr:PilT/PilU family type 4a pilus ATPase [Deltaproteobacteria bacterium]